MIEAIALFFGDVMSFIYGYVPNFGLTIIILTIMVKLITFPLNNKQIESSKRMQKLQPEIKKIQQKYKNDKEKQNKAMSDFMKENKMNPLSGCLPLLVQFPILIGIFQLLRDPLIIQQKLGEAFSPYLFQSAELVNLLYMPSDFYVDVGTLFSQLTVNFGEAGIYYLFPLIAGGTTYIYSQMSMSAESSQKMMLYLMPAMITVFSFTFPVGLVIYWTMNNVFSIGQHKVIDRMDREKTIKEEAEKEKPGKKEKAMIKDKNKIVQDSNSKDEKRKVKFEDREREFFKDGFASYEPGKSKQNENEVEESYTDLHIDEGKKKGKRKGKK